MIQTELKEDKSCITLLFEGHGQAMETIRQDVTITDIVHLGCGSTQV